MQVSRPLRLVGFDRAHAPVTDRADAYDALVDRCKSEILTDIPKGLPLMCAHVRNCYAIDFNDLSVFIGEHADNDMTLMAFMCGHLSAEDYRKWLDARLDEFADRYATERAEYIESAQ